MSTPTIDTYTEENLEPARDYLNDLEALALLTPLSRKFRDRFLELIDKLRAELNQKEKISHE